MYTDSARLLVYALVTLLTLSPASTYKILSNQTLTRLPRPQTDFDIHNGRLLSPILRTRVPGSSGSKLVRNHFTQFISREVPTYNIELHKTVTNGTPVINFIAVRDPPGISKGNISRLTLVAHYDSRAEPAGFIGAIDSAAPVAMILHAIRSIDAALTRKWQSGPELGNPRGVQIIFTDAEEGFREGDDMLYGARALASEWEQSVYAPGSRYPNRIKAIELFVLLDLLGSKGPKIMSFFNATHGAYNNIAVLEKRLRELRQFKSKGDAWFVDAGPRKDVPVRYPIYDDQVPFEQREVDILHLIDMDPGTLAFPTVWHTLEDNGESLDLDVVEDWSVLLTAFVAEWLDLEGYMT
ncbi:peptidase family M28-domain-containing protein [Aspergillus avenaceus]|uniref:Peptide hydrolase n=1 Tax=Aspergillus avenaceus TaxID=36643 RepID=A0A5N6U517_ASPAV|nr:peptidase family M28-domain-containing protein [Aspergillus avenaceus]